jgi:hypothetical protein
MLLEATSFFRDQRARERDRFFANIDQAPAQHCLFNHP